MRHSAHSTTRTVAIRSSANSPVSALRVLVEWAVTNRQRALSMGWSRTDSAFAQMHIGRLQVWLQTHFHGGHDLVRRFDFSHGDSLRYVMPGNAAGKAKLRAYDQLIALAR